MSPEPARADQRPLVGLRVVELGIAIAGPLLTQTLAYYGADVVKVESPTRPDAVRVPPPWIPRDDTEAMAVATDASQPNTDYGAGKKSIALDVKAPRGAEVMARLLASADAFVTNYARRPIQQLGLAYDDVRAINPGIVYVALHGFGATPGAPYSDYVAFGPSQSAVAGLDELTGDADRPPPVTPISFADFGSPAHALVGLLAALEHRDRTGEGQLVDVSQLASTVSFFGALVLAYGVTGELPPRRGNQRDHDAPNGVYPGSRPDSWIAITVESDAEWRALCHVASDEPWTRQPALDTAAGRLADQDALDAGIARWTRRHTVEELEAWLQAAGVAGAVLVDAPHILRDAQLVSRGVFATAPHSRLGRDVVVARPMRLTGTPGRYDRAGPGLGEDTDQILRDWCAYTGGEIDELIERGAVHRQRSADVRLRRPCVPWASKLWPEVEWPT
jgi:benzylsuccinate CoA-transferase BbsF subunit